MNSSADLWSYLQSLKRRTIRRSASMFYAKQQKIRAGALTQMIARTSHSYQHTACYFLPLLSLSPMKGNIKKGLSNCTSRRRRRKKSAGGGVEREGVEIAFIACGRWMMAQHKNPTKNWADGACVTVKPQTSAEGFLPVTYESYLS